MSHHIVEANALGYRYPDGTQALTDISFRILHGESVAIVGANGAGKSTLLLHLSGLLLPQEGSVAIGEVPMTKKNAKVVRRAVGMTFQNPDDQLFMPTVADDVAFGPNNLGLDPAGVAERVQQALEKVGIPHLADRSPHRLSGGEKKAVAIATVLSMSPDILVMDEPTSGLDPRARRQLIALLQTFSHTKIIATHDLDMALDVCDRVLVFKDGTLLADGPCPSILSNSDILNQGGLEKPLRLQGCPICTPKADKQTP